MFFQGGGRVFFKWDRSGAIMINWFDSRVICDNLDNVDTVQPYVFLSSDEPSNQRVPCRGSTIPSLNLGRWKEEPEDSKPMQFLAPNVLLSKISPESLQQLQPTQDSSDAAFAHLTSQSSGQPEIPQLDEFIDEVPKQLDNDQYFSFFGEVEDELNNSISQLFKGNKKSKS